MPWNSNKALNFQRAFLPLRGGPPQPARPHQSWLISCFGLTAPQGVISPWLASWQCALVLSVVASLFFLHLGLDGWSQGTTKGTVKHLGCLLWGPRAFSLQGDPSMVPDTKSNCVAIAHVLAACLTEVPRNCLPLAGGPAGEAYLAVPWVRRAHCPPPWFASPLGNHSRVRAVATSTSEMALLLRGHLASQVPVGDGHLKVDSPQGCCSCPLPWVLGFPVWELRKAA